MREPCDSDLWRTRACYWTAAGSALQISDLGVREGSSDRFYAGHVIAVVGEVVVCHAAEKNTSDQECDITQNATSPLKCDIALCNTNGQV